MHCPNDKILLRFHGSTNEGVHTYACPLCDGQLIIGATHSLDASIGPEKTSSADKVCPRDADRLIIDSSGEICRSCGSIWKESKTKPVDSVGKAAKILSSQIVGLLIVGIGLFSWQMGYLNGSADAVADAAMAPVRIVAIILWFIIFSLIFLIPATVYHQLVLSHRPHFHKVLHHPLIRWLPIVIIGLMAANIYFLTP